MLPLLGIVAQLFPDISSNWALPFTNSPDLFRIKSSKR